MCLVGPHRDDLAITLGGMPARGYASHGEAWSAALALRLGTYDLLTSTAGPDSGEDGEPVLILDDVFAELDGARRSALAEAHRPRAAGRGNGGRSGRRARSPHGRRVARLRGKGEP